MSLELIIIIAVVVFIAAIFLFLAVVRRTVRLAVRLALGLAVVLLIVAGALVWSWYGGSSSTAPQNRPANTRRGNSR